MTITNLKYSPIGSYRSQEEATTSADQMNALHPGQQWTWCRDVQMKLYRIVRVV